MGIFLVTEKLDNIGLLATETALGVAQQQGINCSPRPKRRNSADWVTVRPIADMT
jgi:hypothetical protein